MTISDYHHIMENDRTCGSSVYFQASSTNAGTKLRAAEHPQRALLKGLLKDLGKGSKRKSVVEERGVQPILSAWSMTIGGYHHIVENDRTCGPVYFQASSTIEHPNGDFIDAARRGLCFKGIQFWLFIYRFRFLRQV